MKYMDGLYLQKAGKRRRPGAPTKHYTQDHRFWRNGTEAQARWRLSTGAKSPESPRAATERMFPRVTYAQSCFPRSQAGPLCPRCERLPVPSVSDFSVYLPSITSCFGPPKSLRQSVENNTLLTVLISINNTLLGLLQNCSNCLIK